MKYDGSMSILTIVIPAYNEGEYIQKTLLRIKKKE
jgi:glycosyltransferase involved in cell wall biosynthesis